MRRRCDGWLSLLLAGLLGTTLACSARTSGSDESGDDGDDEDDADSDSDGSETSTGGTNDSSGTDDADDDDDDTGSDDGEDTLFIPTSDMPGVNMCDIWDPEDCPEDQKCTAYATMGSSWDANKCVPIMGDGEPGDPCTAFGDNPGVSGLDDCGEGSMCWHVDADTHMGYCIEFCYGSPNNPMCSTDALCAITQVGVIPICVKMCDPLAPQDQAGCHDTTELCISDPGGNGFVCVLDASGGMGTYGTECQYANSCNYGLFCAAADSVPGCQGSQGCCSEFCAFDQPNTCPGKDEGQECVRWYEENQAPPGYENLGGCAIPE